MTLFPLVGSTSVTGATNRLQRRYSLFYWRQCREGCVRLGLVPVGNGVVVVRAVVCVTVFNRCLDGFGERNRRIEMEAVDARSAAFQSPTTIIGWVIRA